MATALSGAADEFARDEDPELIKGAMPFSLKLMETVLREDPKNSEILASLCKGFSQYAYGFVLQDAEEIEDKDRAAAQAGKARAVKLFLRGRNYGLRYLEQKRPTFAADLKADPKKAVQSLTKADVPVVFWTAVGWAGAISVSKDMFMLPQLPQIEALINRALELDETYDSGAIHGFLMSYEMSRPFAQTDKAASLAKTHYERALALDGGKLAGLHVAYAESAMVMLKNRAEFERLLNLALKIDPNAAPEHRVINLIFQRRARFLLSKINRLFPAAAR